MTYQERYALILAAGYPPLNEAHIKYSLEMGIVRWEVRFHHNYLKLKKRFPSLEIAKMYRDACIANKFVVPIETFIDPKPKNRNLVNRPYTSRQYSGQDIILGPPTVVRCD